MTSITGAQDTDDGSSSALSELDERLLETIERKLPVSTQSKSIAGPQRTLKAAGINARDKTHGRTALHKACSRGNLAKVVDLVEVKGAFLDMTDNAGVTPLHEACSGGHVEVVRYLLRHGVSIGARDCEGDYPLLDAAQNDNLDICRILLEAGANPTIQNSKGMSALSEAEEGSVKELLRQYSSNFESPGQNRMRITDVISIDAAPKDVKSASSPQRVSERVRPRSSQLNIDSRGARKVDMNGRDQLHRYVIDQDDDLVEQFLEIQDCDYQDNYGDTPLHSAARTRNAHICGLLLQHGAKVTIKNNMGNTSLHEACVTSQNKEVIIALLDAGASSLITNNENLTPPELADLRVGQNSTEARLLHKTAQKERAKAFRRRKRNSTRERMSSLSESASLSPTNSPRLSRSTDPPRIRDLLNTSESKVELPVAVAQGKPSPFTNFTPQDIAVTVATSTPPEIISSTKQISRSGVPATQFLTEFKSHCNLSHMDSSVRGSPLPPPPSQPAATTRERARSPQKAVSPLQVTVNAANPSPPPGVIRKRPSLHGLGTLLDDSNSNKRSKGGAETSDHVPESGANVDTTIANALSVAEASRDGSAGDHLAASIRQIGRDMVKAIEKQNEIMMAVLGTLNTMAETQKRQN